MSRLREPPGPPDRFLVGHFPEFLRDRLDFFCRCAEKYGDVVKLKIGKPTFLLSNPEDLKHVLLSNAANYQKTPRLHSDKARRLIGDELLTSTGEAHLKRRQILQPLFSRKALEAFVPDMADATNAMLAGWKSGEVLDIAAEMKNLTLSILIRVIFGKDDSAELRKDILARRKYYAHVLGSSLPGPQYLPIRAVREYGPARKRICDFIDSAIRARRGSQIPSHDMLSNLIHAKHEDAAGLTDAQIRDETISLIDTGFETISIALTWAWYLLSQNPEIESKLSVEVREPNAEFRYAAMVWAETLRLYPPSWMFVRVAIQEDALPSGVTLSAGAKLYLCPYIVHRNPRYFPQPERFDPQRFDDASVQSRPRFAYFPFGGGPHVCIGETFAQIEGVTVLATIAQRFKLKLEADQKITLDAGIALRPKNGIRMRVESC